ncbi:hypothetical protein K438DRAFT_493418 [Mycena galopus ATCC 62051]|nr:hypothetical protein K438DRAFT_493418 [Mycena galopus ATCC 62051]
MQASAGLQANPQPTSGSTTPSSPTLSSSISATCSTSSPPAVSPPARTVSSRPHPPPVRASPFLPHLLRLRLERAPGPPRRRARAPAADDAAAENRRRSEVDARNVQKKVEGEGWQHLAKKVQKVFLDLALPEFNANETPSTRFTRPVLTANVAA